MRVWLEGNWVGVLAHCGLSLFTAGTSGDLPSWEWSAAGRAPSGTEERRAERVGEGSRRPGREGHRAATGQGERGRGRERGGFRGEEKV